MKSHVTVDMRNVRFRDQSDRSFIEPFIEIYTILKRRGQTVSAWILTSAQHDDYLIACRRWNRWTPSPYDHPARILGYPIEVREQP